MVKIFTIPLSGQSNVAEMKSKKMKIVNQNQHTTNVSTQEAIQNAVTNMGFAGDVVLVITNDHEDYDPIYDVYDLQQNYLFSIDTDGDVIFER